MATTAPTETDLASVRKAHPVDYQRDVLIEYEDIEGWINKRNGVVQSDGSSSGRAARGVRFTKVRRSPET